MYVYIYIYDLKRKKPSAHTTVIFLPKINSASPSICDSKTYDKPVYNYNTNCKVLAENMHEIQNDNHDIINITQLYKINNRNYSRKSDFVIVKMNSLLFQFVL